MRHRLTSHRCAEALTMDAHHRDPLKSCDLYFRQSSTARAGSGQLGKIRRGAPKTSTDIRPLLKAIASSKGSLAPMTAAAGNVRSRLVVRTTMGNPAGAPLRISVTVRLANVHRKPNWSPYGVWNSASLPLGTARQVQLPAVTGATRQCCAVAACGWASCNVAAIRPMEVINAPACRPWPSMRPAQPAGHPH